MTRDRIGVIDLNADIGARTSHKRCLNSISIGCPYGVIQFKGLLFKYLIIFEIRVSKGFN